MVALPPPVAAMLRAIALLFTQTDWLVAEGCVLMEGLALSETVTSVLAIELQPLLTAST
jgi:hypothetical protein